MSNDSYGSSKIFKRRLFFFFFSTSNCHFFLRESFKVSKCWMNYLSYHYHCHHLYRHEIMYNYNWLAWKMILKHWNKSTAEYYVMKCIASVYQIGYSLLFFSNTCMLSACLPSSPNFVFFFLSFFLSSSSNLSYVPSFLPSFPPSVLSASFMLALQHP